MRFIAYWLTHGVGAALLGGGTLLFFFGVMNHLATNASSATPAEIAALTQPELEDGVRQLMMTGLTSGLVTAAAVLLGWKLSKPLAFRWTAVVETAEGDAVLHLSALSLEERPKWMTEHPSQQRATG
jgi:hypothetical protein